MDSIKGLKCSKKDVQTFFLDLPMPPQNKIRSTILDIGWERTVPNLFPNGLQKERSQMMKKRQLPKRNIRLIGNCLRTKLNPSQIVRLQL